MCADVSSSSREHNEEERTTATAALRAHFDKSAFLRTQAKNFPLPFAMIAVVESTLRSEQSTKQVMDYVAP